MRKDFFGCRDCGTWGPKSCLVPHSVNHKITACPNCGSGIHTSGEDTGGKVMINKRVEDCINYSGSNRDVCPITKSPVTQLNCFLCRPHFEETRVRSGVHHDCHHPQFRISGETADKVEK